MNVFRSLLLAGLLAFSAIANADVTFKITATPDGGTPTTTTYVLNDAGAFDLGWQFWQWWKFGEKGTGQENKFTSSMCVAPGVGAFSESHLMNLDGNITGDVTLYRLRAVDGAIMYATADGAVYRNAMRLGANFVQKLCVVGNDLFGKGKTDNKWWRWTGSKWEAVPVGYDATILD